MSNIEVSPEDRERLAKSKFGEWFDEFFDKKFEEAFAKKAEVVKSSAPRPQSSAQHPSQPEQPQQPRKRSLIEACLSDTFGF